VNEYRTNYPQKAVTYFTENYPDMAWAVFMAGGSCPSLPVKDIEFLKAAAQMDVSKPVTGDYKSLVKSGTGIIIFAQSKTDIPVQLEKGNYQLKYVDGSTGIITTLAKKIIGNQLFILKPEKAGKGVYWFQKL